MKIFSLAFTLIEVMVVMAIVSIMTAVVLLSLGGGGRIKKELETNAHEFASVVRQAQNYALSGRQLVSNTDPCGFSIIWGASSYSLIYMYKNAGSCIQGPTIATYPLKNGVAFSNSNAFYFTPPWGKIFDSGGVPLESGKVTASFTKNSDSYAVCTYADGKVLETPGATDCP